MLNEPTSETGSLNKRSCLAPTLGVTKFINERYDFGHTLFCYLSRTRMFNKPTSEAGSLNKCSCLARALGVTKFVNMRDMI